MVATKKDPGGSAGATTGEDFRSAPMPSPEGRGKSQSRFRRAWQAYSEAVAPVARPVLGPVVEPLARVLGRETTFDLMGFWLTWQLHGGFEGMQKDLQMSRSAVYRRVSLFRKATGKHPDEFRLPGVAISVEKYLAGDAKIAPVQERDTVAE